MTTTDITGIFNTQDQKEIKDNKKDDDEQAGMDKMGFNAPKKDEEDIWGKNYDK